MSMLIACAVRDEKADCYAHPFFVPALGLAIRMFLDWTKDPKTVVGAHPEDYRLFRVGLFDQVAGVFKPEATPVFIQSADTVGELTGDVDSNGDVVPIQRKVNRG